MGSLGEQMERISQRLSVLEDQHAVGQVLVRYAYFADTPGCADAWVSLWDVDGTFELDAVRDEQEDRFFRGHEELKRFITGPSMPPAGLSHHHVNGLLSIEIDGDGASATTYSVTLVKYPDGIRPLNMGFRRWTFVRRDSQWKIASCLRREAGRPGAESVIRVSGGLS